MAIDIKYSELPAASSVALADIFGLSQSGTSRRGTIGQVQDAVLALGAKYISYAGTAAGLSFSSGNDATLSGALAVAAGAVTITNASAYKGLSIIRTGGAGGLIKFQNGAASGQYNFFVGHNYNTTNVFEVIPSTATDGDTIGTTVFSVTQAGAGLFSGTLTAVGAFGCNTKAAQTAYASGGALNAYGAGASGLDSGANMSALHAMVVSIRAALVADGIMS